jgi:hypothetical protein
MTALDTAGTDKWQTIMHLARRVYKSRLNRNLLLTLTLALFISPILVQILVGKMCFFLKRLE